MPKTHTPDPADLSLKQELAAAGVVPEDIKAFEDFFGWLGKPAEASARPAPRMRPASAKATGLDVESLVARCRAAIRPLLIAALPDHVRTALRGETDPDPIQALPSRGGWNDGRLAQRLRGPQGAHP